MITAGQRGDSPQFEAVLEAIRVPRLGLGRPRKRPDRVRADKAYDSRSNRFYLRRRGIKATIPVPADRVRIKRGSRGGRPPKFDTTDYKQRNAVECGINHRSSTRPITSSGTRSSAGSTGSSATGPWPPGTTNSLSATKRRCWSQPSTNGCDQHRRNGPQTTSNSFPSGSCIAAA
ncbi:hypothetical protein GCM10010274_65550 [Streptomyces lavendofoliae]|uniref:Transposase IS4-like domain-containing protein n=1 Tax=Streptomyces lavendofoliae TaxID=67314 RepID=A0A918I4B6_9ACTN|nr:hypothetical protein GCM10010274_65550 [Streptomyces lavendofoliae]